jgi:hypothetical protein
MAWRTIYDLRRDTRRIASVQQTSLEGPKSGLKPEPALFGSDEWWGAIDEGSLPVLVASGTITRVYMTGHNDFPQFDLETDAGVTLSLEQMGDERAYKPGQHIRVSAVIQHVKDDKWMRKLKMDRDVKQVITIEVEDPDSG